MKIKLIILLSVATISLANAQGFSSFSVKGELQKAVIKNNANRLSTVDAIISEETDIKNLDFKYRMLSNSFLSKDLSKDFTDSQLVTIDRRNGDSREWRVTVKQLKKASLPLNVSFSEDNPYKWDNSVFGWAGIGVDESRPSVIRFGNFDVSFYIAFKEPAETLSFELKPVSREKVVFDGVLVLETSSNGLDWSILEEFNRKNDLKEQGLYEYTLNQDVRYVRWVYKERNKLNINLNNIEVKAK